MISQGNTGQVNASTKNPGSYQNIISESDCLRWIFNNSANNILDIPKILLHDLKLKDEIDISISHELSHWWLQRITLG